VVKSGGSAFSNASLQVIRGSWLTPVFGKSLHHRAGKPGRLEVRSDPGKQPPCCRCLCRLTGTGQPLRTLVYLPSPHASP